MNKMTPQANISILGVCGSFSITSGATYPANTTLPLHKKPVYVYMHECRRLGKLRLNSHTPANKHAMMLKVNTEW